MRKLRNGGGATPLSTSSLEIDTIANKNYNSSMKTYNSREGFTLAEVLITLAIIGIVAALTIPNLVQQYRKKSLETGLVKFYSTFNEAFKLSSVENGFESQWTNYSTDSCAFYEKYLAKYLKVQKYECGYYHPDNGNFVSDNRFVGIYLQSGELVVFTYGYNFYYIHNPKKYHNRYPSIGSGSPEDVAINSEYGTNIFCFALANRTKPDKSGIIPFGFYTVSDEAIYESCENSRHYTCAALIARNEWKIPDNYPFKF